MPKDCANYMHSSLVPLYNDPDWIIVRTYDEFVNCILESGMPGLISFDHDIEADQIDDGVLDIKNCKIIYGKTGYDCAKWLTTYCEEYDMKLPQYFVHSANPVGAANIRLLLENYERYFNTLE